MWTLGHVVTQSPHHPHWHAAGVTPCNRWGSPLPPTAAGRQTFWSLLPPQRMTLAGTSYEEVAIAATTYDVLRRPRPASCDPWRTSCGVVANDRGRAARQTNRGTHAPAVHSGAPQGPRARPASLGTQYTRVVTAASARVRLAELVATISLGTDLGLGQPMEHVIRQTIIALRLADLLDLDEQERVVVYYSGTAGLGGLPHRRLRTGQVVRRRHRDEAREHVLRRQRGRLRPVPDPQSRLRWHGDATECARPSPFPVAGLAVVLLDPGEPLEGHRPAGRAARPG